MDGTRFGTKARTGLWALAGFGALLSACGRPAASPVEVTVPSVPAGASGAAPAAVALPDATPAEKELAERLKATVQHFSVEVGERNLESSWNLATATDDLALGLEKLGYEVRRQGVVIGDAVLQNVEAHVSGGEHGSQTIVVGAHFDTAVGTPGADANASGVAAVLELARVFHDKTPKRGIRFAFFTDEEAPHFGTDHMGSLVYAKELLTQGLQIVGMLSLEGLGAYSAAPNSEHAPPELANRLPTTADFVAVVANEASRPLLEQVTGSLKKHGPVPVFGDVFDPAFPFASASDHSSFWKLGLPAVMVTDTASVRYSHYHAKTDLPAELDFDRMARVVTALEAVVAEIAEDAPRTSPLSSGGNQ
jgi:hypothetical protein